MTESSRHANAVKAIKKLLVSMDATVYENDDSRGHGGWKLPPIQTDKGTKQYILDVFARLPDGSFIDVEVDYFRKGTPIAADKMFFRDHILSQFGITTIRCQPMNVDLWLDEPKLFIQEVYYWKQKQKERLQNFQTKQKLPRFPMEPKTVVQ